MADGRDFPMDHSRSADNADVLALELVGSNKEVLGVGCPSASLTEGLASQGCTVSVVDSDDSEWPGVDDESFDVVVLAEWVSSRDPYPVLCRAARKMKASGVLVARLPNVNHGSTGIAIEKGRFRYGRHGLLEGPHVKHFTPDAIRELFRRSGLVIVDTARVVVPLVEAQFGVTRAEVAPHRLHDLLNDPEGETYEFVLRAVRDNGDRAVAELTKRVDELNERAREETVRTAVLRAELWQMQLLFHDLERHRKLAGEQRQTIEEQQRYIEALEGHASGLERNVEVLTQSLQELQAAMAAIPKHPTNLARRTARRVLDGLTRQPKKS